MLLRLQAFAELVEENGNSVQEASAAILNQDLKQVCYHKELPATSWLKPPLDFKLHAAVITSQIIS